MREGRNGGKLKSGNLKNNKGRPKLPDLKEVMAKILSEEKSGIQALEAIVRAQMAKAAKGDTKAAEFLLDRGYGKVNQTVDMFVEQSIFKKIDLDVDKDHSSEEDSET